MNKSENNPAVALCMVATVPYSRTYGLVNSELKNKKLFLLQYDHSGNSFAYVCFVLDEI